jgi:predicted PurR-regulated permease PerM
VGTFLIPYSIFELVRGNTYLAVGLLILYAVQTVIRQFAEPKILGKNLGVHPLLTLVILYVGYALFGFVGLLLVPLFTVIAEILFAEKNSSDVVETPPAERDGK